MIGRRLAHYDITAHLGSGAMGDVYQATDNKLGRSVALKFLPEAFAHDVESATRFRREAKTLASLNHPRIAAIHGIEEAEGRSFLVMEFVPGQTLADRIRHRSIPLDEAVGIARQIAEALEAAHEKGIVHRDLKPANVKITPDGQVKVLDFGLAKPGADGTSQSSSEISSEAPTMVATATQPGFILGTPAYMAPEQAKGQPVDGRTDIFALGCILYEMLSGRRAFGGDNVSETLSRVLQREPEWTLLPSSVPASVQRVVRLCLEKDPRRRRQAAGDVRIDLEHALSESVDTAPVVIRRRSRLPRLLWIASAAVVLTALGIPAWIHSRETPPPEMRLQIVTPPSLDPLQFALSPDGRHLVFVAFGASGEPPQRLYLRTLDNTEPALLAGTEGAQYPFWSPDSRSIGFFANLRVFRIDIAGGPPKALAFASNAQGGTWSEEGTIVFAPDTVSPLSRVSASGQELPAATQLESPGQTAHQFPSFLPGGRQFLFYVQGKPDVSGIYLGSLDGGKPKRLTEAGSAGTYLAPNRLAFVQGAALVARDLDVSRGELTGDPVTLASSVGTSGLMSGFSISAAGLVAYRNGTSAPRRLTRFDHDGKILATSEDLNGPELSPNGHYLALDRSFRGNRDVWILDIGRGALTPFTFDPAIDGYPVWSWDGSRIAFESKRKGTLDLWVKPSSGATEEELVFEAPDTEYPLDWSRDGYLLFQQTDLKSKWDLLALPMTGDKHEPIVVANTPFEERTGKFSPDGHWVAYATNASGRREVVVQAFPVASGIVPVSTNGGDAPRWRNDGKEIYFIAADEKMMAVPVVTSGTAIDLGKPSALFSSHIALQTFKHQYTVGSDGQFIVATRLVEEASASPITMILNGK
jgi:eukaryotic-like serine/threonine-protein kinase